MGSSKKNILITTDSLCDLPQTTLSEYDIVVNPYLINTSDGSFLDNIEITTPDLITYLSKEGNIAKAVAPDKNSYLEFFREQKNKADVIIHIFAAKYISSGFEQATEAANEIGNVFVFNSGHISGGVGLTALKAAQLCADGYSAQRILEILEVYTRHISTSFVVMDSDYQVALGKMSPFAASLTKKLLIHPIVSTKNGKAASNGFVFGDFEGLTGRYFRKLLNNPWEIDTSSCILVHAGLDDKKINIILNELKNHLQFSEILIQEASTVNTCIAGHGAFGIMFVRNSQKIADTEKKDRKINLLKRIQFFLSQYMGFLVKENFSVQHRMLNIILACALIGGTLSSLVTLISSQNILSFIVTIIMVFFVGLALYISVVRDNYKIAALMIDIFANIILFPLMFFTSGGMYSGMTAWLVLGLIFTWLLLDGISFYVLLTLNLFVFEMTIYLSTVYPQLVTKMPEKYIMTDIMQSIFIVSCIFGIIFKYQTYTHNKQKELLLAHEKELLAATNAKSTFLANMSHEIRTPINGILGMDTMMLRECGDNEAIREYALNIQSAGKSLLSIINDILDISKIESGRLELIPDEYDMFSTLNDCYNISAARAIEKGLDFVFNADPLLPSRLYGDEARVHQIINNFLSNAIKYTPAGTVTLNISHRIKSDSLITLVISVTDTGIGIKPENIDHLFDSFTRFDEKRNKNIEGTGLGLNLTYNLVKLMGGEIYVDSVYNQGSTFTAEIPQIVRSNEPMGDFSENYKRLLEQTGEDTGKIYAPSARILVVDDVAMNLLVAKGLLKYTGAEIATAASGGEALRMMSETKYDLILLDHMMPEMDGIETLQALKAMTDGINIGTPVIALTANAIMGAKEQYIAAGFTDYLSKPIAEGELMKCLVRYLPENKLEQTTDIATKTTSSKSETTSAKDELSSIADSTGAPTTVASNTEAISDNTSPSQSRSDSYVRQLEKKCEPNVASATDSSQESIISPTADSSPESLTASSTEAPQENITASNAEAPQENITAFGAEAPQPYDSNEPPIDLPTALGYCMDDMDFFKEVVAEYLSDIKFDIMENYYEAEDTANYAIYAHGLKSSSLIIGAVSLSEHAKAMEFSCKASDVSYLKNNHRALMEEYKAVVEFLKANYA